MSPLGRLRFTAVALAITLLLLSSAPLRAQPLTLTVVGGSGHPGDTVEVAIQLSGDSTGSAATADLDLGFPAALVEFVPPVNASCTIAPRLAATHQIGGMPLEPGLVSMAIFARDLMIAPLGNGDLATCEFRILPDADGSTAPLTLAFVGLGSARGAELPVVGVGGSIAIVPPCIGDCNGSAVVTIDELIRGVQIVLGNLPPSACTALDRSGRGISVPDLIAAVNSVLQGCP
jgi:hypothetical protein